MNLHDIFCVSSMVEAPSGGTTAEAEGNFTLIEKINVSDSNLSMIMRTSEPDGTPYDFKKVLIKVIVPQGKGKSTGQINFNNESVALWRDDMVLADKKTASVVKAVIENGNLDVLPLCAYAIDERTAPTCKLEHFFTKMERIHTISVFVSTGSICFPSGTVIEIYAIRRRGVV